MSFKYLTCKMFETKMLSLEGCTSVYSHKKVSQGEQPSSESLSRMLKTWHFGVSPVADWCAFLFYYSCLLCMPLRMLHTVSVGGKVSGDHAALPNTALSSSSQHCFTLTVGESKPLKLNSATNQGSFPAKKHLKTIYQYTTLTAF